MNGAAQQYKQNSVLTATPADLTLQLYTGLLKFMKLALSGLEQGDIQITNTNLIKSQDILRELLCTLDLKYPLAQNMAAMYEYMLERLIQANVSKDKEMIVEVIGYTEEFRNTWYQAMKLAK